MLDRHLHTPRMSRHHGDISSQRHQAYQTATGRTVKRGVSDSRAGLGPLDFSDSGFFGAPLEPKNSPNPGAPSQTGNPTPSAVPTTTGGANLSTPSQLASTSVTDRAGRATPSAVLLVSKTNSIVGTCSGLAACAVKTGSSLSSSSATNMAKGGSGAQEFFASLGSSPGSIFFTCLVGIAILGVTVAIVSFALRRWCNRRRKNTIDDDNTWRFLETPKEFSQDLKLEEDSASLAAAEKHVYPATSLTNLAATLSKQHTPSHPFESHLQQQSQQSGIPNAPDYSSTPQFHQFMGFQPPQPQRLSCFIDEQNVSWVNTTVPPSAMYAGVILAPFGATVESTNTHANPRSIPELMVQKPTLEGFGLNKSWHAPTASILTPPGAAHLSQADPNVIKSRLAYTPLQDRNSRASMLVPSTTPAIQPLGRPRSVSWNAKTDRHPLSRELSIACSEQSTTVEELREQLAGKKIDLRATLIGAIQRDKLEEEKFLEILRFNFETETQKEETEVLGPPLVLDQGTETQCWSPTSVLRGAYGLQEHESSYSPKGRPSPATPRPLDIQKRNSLSTSTETESGDPKAELTASQRSGGSCYSIGALGF